MNYDLRGEDADEGRLLVGWSGIAGMDPSVASFRREKAAGGFHASLQSLRLDTTATVTRPLRLRLCT